MSEAKQRYKVDKKAIILNSAVSGTSTLTVGGILKFLSATPTGQMPLILTAVFTAQVLPKLLVEYNKRYHTVKAQREAFRDGRTYDTNNMALNWPKNLFYLLFSGLDKATYF